MISREEASRLLDPEIEVEAMAEIEYYAGFYGGTAVIKAMYDARKMGAEALRKERPKGRWVHIKHTGFHCSNCQQYSRDYKETNYCPNCGADMRGEEE